MAKKTIDAQNVDQIMNDLDDRLLDLFREKLSCDNKERAQEIKEEIKEVRALQAECQRIVRNRKAIRATIKVAKARKAAGRKVSSWVGDTKGKVSVTSVTTRLQIARLEAKSRGRELRAIYEAEIAKDND